MYATSTSTTIPNNVPNEIDQGRSDESISTQMNRRMDEMMRQFQQVQASLNSSCVPKIPRERHAIVCYSCRVVGHITSRCPQRRQGGWGRGMYQVQGGQGLPSNNIPEGVSGVTLRTTQVPQVLNLLSFIDDDEDEECNVFPIKRMSRTSNKDKEMEEECSALQRKKKAKGSTKEEQTKWRRS